MTRSGFLHAFASLGDALGDPADMVLTLRLDQIDEDPDNPRRSFDDAELEALAKTVAARGVLQPIVVRPADPQGRYRLRFGARRFRAARRAGLTEIPALVRAGELDPAETLIEQMIENDQREGLSTAELAGAVERLLGLGLTQADVGQRLGRSKPQIAMLAAVKGMAPELRALAPKLGARTLYELHAAWKLDTTRTKRFLKGRRPETITQAEARELAGRTASRVIRDPSDGSVRALSDAEPPARANSPASRASPGSTPRTEPSTLAASPGVTARFEVIAGRLKGTLVLDNVSEPSRGVIIRTSSGELHPAAAEKVKIVRVLPG